MAPKPMRWHAQQLGCAHSVVSLGSWSKLLGPGLRLGWLEADESAIRSFAADGEVVSGSWTSPLTESLLTRMLTSGGAPAHVEALRRALARRATLLAEAIQAEQPVGTPPLVQPAPAGYFLWVNLQGLDAHSLRERCVASHGVAFLPGLRCALPADDDARSAAASHARVCFAFLEEVQLVEAGRRLGRAIAEAHADARLP